MVARNEIHLSSVHNFGGGIVRLSRNRGTEAEDLSRIGNSHDQRLAFPRRGCELRPSGTEHVNSTRGLTFDKQHGSLRVHRCGLDRLKRLKRPGREIAKKAIEACTALQAVVCYFQPIWRMHLRPSSEGQLRTPCDIPFYTPIDLKAN